MGVAPFGSTSGTSTKASHMSVP
ncbi:hypothetical protein [Bacteroides zoogleoformans]|nr:hypothetical protein [Bacteroides zoogleoformans]